MLAKVVTITAGSRNEIGVGPRGPIRYGFGAAKKADLAAVCRIISRIECMTI